MNYTLNFSIYTNFMKNKYNREMIKRFVKRYFSIIFIVATLLGVLHHHNDLRVHNDCKICIIQSNIVDGDIPITITYLSHLDIKSEKILPKPKILHISFFKSTLNSRAPPKFS